MPIAQTQSGYKLLYWEDDFESYPTGAWSGADRYDIEETIAGGSHAATIEAGKYIQGVATGGTTVYNVKVRGFTSPNVLLSYEAQLGGASTNEQPTGFIRHTALNNDLTVRLNHDATSGINLSLQERFDGPPGIALDVDNYAAGVAGVWYYVEAQIIGNNVTAVLKDITQTTTYASVSGTTTVGADNSMFSGFSLAGSSSIIRIDNFNIKAL